MGNVEIPKWLKSLPLAPEFRPTDTEFADPIAYISKIEKEVAAFGICKVIPPLPKPSKKYVFNNLNKSLLRTSELGLDLNVGEVGDLSKKSVQEKRHDDFRENRAVFTTRQQELGQASKRSRAVVDAPQPAAQKQVWQSGEFYTLEQFELKSKVFSKSVLGMVKDVTPLVIEALFWKASLEKPIYIEYANDVPGSGFGKPEGLLRYFQAPRKRRRIGRSYWQPEGGDVARNVCTRVDFEGLNSCPSIELRMEHIESPSSSSNKMSHSNEVEGSAGWKLSNCPWNLQVIARSAGSLTRFMLDDIPGVTSPMVYVGMLFSWFAWHVEDHELHSLNFLHTGSPKTWYAVPGEYAFAFEDVIRTQAYGGDVDHLAALKILGEKTTLLSPETVVASGIPCCRLVQNPGEFVVTFPRAYHVGFSHGFNCGEAANFGTPQWLTLAKEAAVRRAAMDQLPMLSHQQLLYLLTMSFLSRVPSTQLPCVRTSRLRNRLKEERELLVKKAFIEDVLKENRLLNALLGKDPAFRAILWHPDSLPSLNRDSLSHTGMTPDTVLSKEDNLSVQPQKGLNQDIHHLTSSKQPLNDTYLESNDLLCDFQVDSGTLVCVACGILGYPIMSVIQPSNKASIEMLYPKNKSKTKGVDIPHQQEICPIKYGSKNSLPDTLDDGTWNTSVLLRPRFFCLEHAVQIVELLRPKGGAKVLVICHSDYQKIMANAVAVSEELKTTFTYKEAQLDSASSEELKLIDFAIDEQLTDLQEDWTSKLGINLKFSVKTRKGCFSKSANHALNIDYLLSTMAPSSKISSIRWSSKKLRTKRESNRRTVAKFRDSNLSKDVKIHLSDCTDKKEKVLLQYFRRKYKSQSKIFTGRKFASGCSMVCLAEVVDANDGKIDGVNEQNTSRICCSKDEETASKEFGTSPEKCVVQAEVETLEANREFTSSKSSGAVVIAKALASASGDSNLPRVSGVVQESYKANGDPDGENWSSSLAIVTTTFDMAENLDDTETCECHSLSTCTKSTTAMKVDVPNFNRTDKARRKRRKVELQSEAQNSFVKSPCEGLRPRRNKQDSVDTLKTNVPEMAGKISTTKKLKKATESSIPGYRVPANKTAYGCSREGCRMRFRTRAQQTLHKRNQCHHKDCGKRFKSHKYVVLHQRVHDDERPLKCTWTGCTMSFKWAWARTEHLRLHTGARPYSCKFKGCDLTFRFVSDFSRHRRKFGHYTNLATK